jgi:UDP-N-acetylglucosamine--N-acetylmuramyl-(pentapeptide) pyrophosphoryl-undecaprenol N-acetylglucosamine transferase
MSFAGNPEGMERDLAAAAGLEFVPLAARPLVGRSPAGRIRAAVTVASSARAARRWMRTHDVAVVVATGGYASAPAVVGAAWARRPVLLVEPNARAGLANRWLSRFAASAATAWESTGRELRCPSFVSGVPVRAEFFTVEDLAASAPPHLLVLGGSQGARQLNEIVPRALGGLLERLPELTVLHQCGERNLAECRALWSEVGEASGSAEVVAFVDDVPAEMARSTLVLSRAGAITLAEICAAGRPSLLVPLGLAGGHQRANAEQLVEAGAAELLDEAVDGEELARRLTGLLGDGVALAEKGVRARALARPRAAASIADRVDELARVSR